MRQAPVRGTKIRLDPQGTSLDPSRMKWMVNSRDEHALIRALELKRQNQGIVDTVTVISAGGRECALSLRKALALGADAAIHVDTELRDAHYTAGQIAEIIKKENFDIVFTAIETDGYFGYPLGYMLAELTGYPCLPAVSSVSIEKKKAVVHRDLNGRQEIIEAEIPFIAVVQKGMTSAPGLPSMREIREAVNKNLSVVKPAKADCYNGTVKSEFPAAEKKCTVLSIGDLKGLAGKLHEWKEVHPGNFMKSIPGIRSVAMTGINGSTKLAESAMVVAGGMGLRTRNNWKYIQELADLLGAATACTRPAWERGICPHDRYIGLTGHVISPLIYVAIGISGAEQHICGLNSPGVIIAVNSDPEAPIFKVADYGIIGDIENVMPQLLDALKGYKMTSSN
jgi:electron transfer flavoprotein beta subunit